MPGYVYPNEAEVGWSLLIVLYPFITGLVAGAFVVSSLYHVFNIKSLKPVARLSLLTALSFLLVAPLSLQAHLGRPERGFEIFLTPNFTSAMAGFGYIWLFYLLLVITEVWLVFRPDIILYAHTSSGPKRLVYQILTLGVPEMTKEARHFDEKLIKVLATIGIPAAVMLHGYVGFIFGSIKANPWWSTPLMPVIFLLSAIVSGMALLLAMYIAITKLRGKRVDEACVRSLAQWLMAFLLIDLTIEGLEVLSMAYESEESWDIVSRLIAERIPISYLGIQIFLGSFIPLVILIALAVSQLKGEAVIRWAFLTGILVVVGVFAMRWNVVIGGQLISKSQAGFLSYTPSLGGREGILAALVFLLLPFYIFSTLANLIPPWDREEEEALERGEPEPSATAAPWVSATRVQEGLWEQEQR